MAVPAPDPDRARAAVASLLAAVGAPIDTDPELRETPDRVARMYLDELLDGYRADLAAIARGGTGSGPEGFVMLTGIRYVSFCPHHLLPARGRADVGYWSTGTVAGLGTIVKLLEACAHRLILQEALGDLLVRVLMDQLRADGAAVRLRARHDCVASRGERQRTAALVTVSRAGRFERDADARAMFTRSLPTRSRSK